MIKSIDINDFKKICMNQNACCAIIPSLYDIERIKISSDDNGYAYELTNLMKASKKSGEEFYFFVPGICGYQNDEDIINLTDEYQFSYKMYDKFKSSVEDLLEERLDENTTYTLLYTEGRLSLYSGSGIDLKKYIHMIRDTCSFENMHYVIKEKLEINDLKVTIKKYVLILVKSIKYIATAT